MIHQDERRTLHEWATGNFKTLKAVYVHQEIPIGAHHHKKKDEVFFLASGKIKELTLGEIVMHDITAPYSIDVPRGTYHKFIMEKGSILFGATTELFDPTDEIK